MKPFSINYNRINDIIDYKNLQEREMVALIILDEKYKEDEDRFYTSKEVSGDVLYSTLQYMYRPVTSAASALSSLKRKGLIDSAVVVINNVARSVYKINEKGRERAVEISIKLTINKEDLERELNNAKNRVKNIEHFLYKYS